MRSQASEKGASWLGSKMRFSETSRGLYCIQTKASHEQRMIRKANRAQDGILQKIPVCRQSSHKASISLCIGA